MTMYGPRARRALLGLPAMWAVALALAPMPASAATTEIGAVNEIAAGLAPAQITAAAGGPFYAVQIGESNGTYAVPAGYGVLTAWRHSTGTTPGELTFKVYRPTGSPGEFLVLAADTQVVTPRTVHTFPVRVPVAPGDRIGISTSTVEAGYLCEGQAALGMCVDPAAQADRAGVFSANQPDPPAGTRATLDGPPFEGFRADVAAIVETDADRDGFGDDTQDGCPASAATRPPCPVVANDPPPSPQLPPFADCPASVTGVVHGSGAGDILTGTVGADRVFAGTGGDRVDGLAGDDCIDLGPGSDRGQGGPGADLLLGGSGDDRMHGTAGNDRLAGGSGRDRTNGGAGRDRIAGGAGNDRIAGGAGNDRIAGGAGNDRIAGGAGNDRIAARDRRRDKISCGRGRDTVAADRSDRVARDCERVR